MRANAVVAVQMSPVQGEALASLHRRTQLLNGPERHAANFGPKNARWNDPDWCLPTGLDHYAKVFGDAIGLKRPRDWIDQHTLAPFFEQTMAPIARRAFESRLVECLPGPRRPLLPVTLSEWFAQSAVLCRECDEESIATYGFSIVQRRWLLPFATRCCIHGAPLATFANWSPVERGLGTEIQRISRREDEGIHFGRCSEDLLRHGEGLLEQLGGLLQSRGFTTRGGQLRRTALATALARHASGRYEHAQFNRLLSTPDRVTKLLAPLGARRGLLHPSVAAVLVDALKDLPEIAQIPIAAAPPRVDRAALELALLRGATPTSAAKVVGVSVQTALVQARAMGLTVSQRPKRMKGHLLERIQSMLLSGIAVAEVAHDCGVSVATVYRTRSSVCAFTCAGRQRALVNKASELDQRTQRWIELGTSNPGASASALRSLAPADYAYLYRNARDWLREYSAARASSTAVAASMCADNSCGVPGVRSARRGRAPEGADFVLVSRIVQTTEHEPLRLRRRQTTTLMLRQAGRAMAIPAVALAATTAVLYSRAETQERFVLRRLQEAAKRLTSRGEELVAWRIIREAGVRAEFVVKLGIDVLEAANVARAEVLRSL